jgi:4-hydroxy-3-methylbut-2-enyl diphosphate reductase
VLIEEVIDAFSERFDVSLELVTTTTESISFNLPRQLREAAE